MKIICVSRSNNLICRLAGIKSIHYECFAGVSTRMDPPEGLCRAGIWMDSGGHQTIENLNL